MRRTVACISLTLAILAAGCGGGGVEADLEKSGDDLRKEASKMSVADLEKKVDELKKYGEKLKEEAGDSPSEAEAEKLVKLMEVLGIYGAELTKRKMR